MTSARQQKNKQAMNDWRNAVYAAVKASSGSALAETAKFMVEKAVDYAEFNDYSGVLINSYVATAIYRDSERVKSYLNKSGLRVRWFNSDTFYDKNVTYTSFKLPGVSKIQRAEKVKNGRGWRKKLQKKRSHDYPEYIISKYNPYYGSYVNAKGDSVGRAILNYNKTDAYFKRNTSGAKSDGVFLTNSAPYAQEVHTRWHRVLPGNEMDEAGRFYKRVAMTKVREFERIFNSRKTNGI